MSLSSVTNNGAEHVAALQQRIAELEHLVANHEHTIATLHESAARFQRITSNIPGMVYQLCLRPDGSLSFPYMSDTCQEMFGISPQELQADGQKIIAMIHADDLDNFQRSIAESAAKLTPWQWEGRFVTAEGTVRWVQGSSRPQRTASEDIVWDGLLRDITADKQKEQQQQRTYRLLYSIVENIPHMIIVKDAVDLHFVLLNKVWEDMMGSSRSLLLGKTDYDISPREEADFFTKKDREVLASNEPLDIPEESLQTSAHETRMLHTKKIPILGDNGKPEYLLVIAEDITERKAAEEAFRLSIAQEETIRAQENALRELSTPIIPLTDTVMVMPLVGALDSRRAQQVLETLLEGVAAQRARMVILDITGVPVVDTQVANALLRAAQAVKLLGAQIILTGIRPEVAQTLVGLGIDMTGITTLSTLQNGITLAIGRNK
jgi:rsbT co-antagonist protein RsbR